MLKSCGHEDITMCEHLDWFHGEDGKYCYFCEKGRFQQDYEVTSYDNCPDYEQRKFTMH